MAETREGRWCRSWARCPRSPVPSMAAFRKAERRTGSAPPCRRHGVRGCGARYRCGVMRAYEWFDLGQVNARAKAYVDTIRVLHGQ
jgi:hypothetical protein